MRDFLTYAVVATVAAAISIVGLACVTMLPTIGVLYLVGWLK